MQAYSAINGILVSSTCTYQQFQTALKEHNITQETYLNLFLTTVVVEKSRHPDFAKFVYLLTNFREITGKKSADINYLGYKDRVSILMHACRRGTQQTIISLLSFPNIDLKATDPTGRNAAFYAIRNSQQQVGTNILHLLFQHNPKLIDSLANEGQSLLNEAIDCSKSSIVQFLLRKGANPNTKLKNTGNTVSHQLIKLFNSHKEQVNLFIILLLKNKANFEEVNTVGKSVFQALQEGGFDVEDEIHFCGFLENSASQIDEADIEFDKESLTTINQKTKIGDSTSQIFELESNFCSLKVDFSEIDYQEEIQNDTPHSESPSDELNSSQSESAFALSQVQQDSNASIASFSQEIINLSQQYQREHHKTFEQMAPLFHAIDKIVQKYGLSFELVGSFATGLWTQHSDIDINLIPITSQFINFESTLERISIKLRLKRAQLGIEEIFLNKNKISTIRLLSGPRYNNKRMDISIFHRNNLNRRYVAYINESLQQRPEIRPLFFANKKLLETFHLHDHLSGGIKTYTLFLMINSVVRSLPTNDVGTLFIHLALYYGFYFEYDFDIKQIKDLLNQEQDPQSDILLNITEIVNFPHKKFNLMDPINPKNNMGGKNTKTQEMKNMFRSIYYMISSTNKPSLDTLLQLHSIFD